MFIRFFYLLCLLSFLGAGCISSSAAEEMKPTAAIDLRSYQEYSEQALSIAREQDKPYILFFYANWCKNCHEQEPVYQRILSASNKIIGLRVNFDARRDLVQTHRVFLQNTAIFFDAHGNEVKRLIGPQTEQAIKEALAMM